MSILISNNYSLKSIESYFRENRYHVIYPQTQRPSFESFIKDTYSIFENNNIDFVLLHSDGGKLGVVSEIAKQHDIPSIVLQNGVWPTLDDYSKSHYRFAGNSSNILCMSNYMRDCYIKIGVDKKKLTVTGHPYFDNYKNIRRKMPDGNKVVLVLFELAMMETRDGNMIPWFHSPPIKFENYFGIFDLAEEMPEYKFIISLKPHGLLQPHHFKQITDNILVENKPLINWLDKVDVVLGSSSTSIAETIFNGIPTIVPKLEMEFLDYKKAAIEIEWDRYAISEAIDSSIGMFVDNQEFNEYYFSHNLDYKATNRVINYLEEILNV